MKYAILVALREYAENARTKGFWIGLMLFPIFIWVGVQVPRFLEKATPARHFVLVDQSGRFDAVIEKALARYHTRKKAEAFGAYARKYADPAKAKKQDTDDPENTPVELLDMGKVLEKLADSAPETLDLLGTAAGWRLSVIPAQSVLLKDCPPFEPPDPKFVRVKLEDVVPEGTSSEELKRLSEHAKAEEIINLVKPWLLGEKQTRGEGGGQELFAAVVVPARVRSEGLLASIPKMGRSGGTEYWSINLTDTDLQDLVRNAVNEEYRRATFVAKGVNPKTVRAVQTSTVPFHKKNPKKAAGQEDVSLADVIRQYAPIGFVYLLWIAIVTVSQMLLNNTIEEKSNRIIEVLLSSVTPRELMLGKLMGIAGIGLTMTGAWLLSMLGILTLYRSPEAEWVDRILEVLHTSNLLPMFAVYFLLGYLFYAGIFLAIGSLCNTIKEAQNFMGPIMLIMMVPLVTMFFIPKDPNGTLATVLSWIPIYTPFVMMNRAAADPPMFDQVGTIVLMIISVIVVLWLSAKIFRRGILRSGQPPKILELLGWFRDLA